MSLHDAARKGNIKQIQRLLDAKSNPNRATLYGALSIHYASAYGYDGCVALLLDAKSNPNHANTSGHLPIHYASANGHDGCVAILLDAKSNPNLLSTFFSRHRTALGFGGRHYGTDHVEERRKTLDHAVSTIKLKLFRFKHAISAFLVVKSYFLFVE